MFPFLTGKFEAGLDSFTPFAVRSCFHSLQENLKLEAKLLKPWHVECFHSLQENLKLRVKSWLWRVYTSFPFLTGKFEAHPTGQSQYPLSRFHSLQENLKPFCWPPFAALSRVSIPYRKIWSRALSWLPVPTCQVSIPYRKIWSEEQKNFVQWFRRFPFLTGKFEAHARREGITLVVSFHSLQENLKPGRKGQGHGEAPVFPFLTGKFEAR